LRGLVQIWSLEFCSSFVTTIHRGLRRQQFFGFQIITMTRGRKRPDNKPDAVNPAMALWLTIEDQLRRVTDLERSA
jgi:hypothetical protein